MKQNVTADGFSHNKYATNCAHKSEVRPPVGKQIRKPVTLKPL